MRTRAHGTHRLRWIGDILYCQPAGNWNIEQARAFVADVEECIAAASRNGEPWCRIVDLRDYGLHTPEVKAVMHRFFHWARQAGCVAHVYVCESGVLKDIVAGNCRDAGADCVMVETCDQAIAYCEAQLEPDSYDGAELAPGM